MEKLSSNARFNDALNKFYPIQKKKIYNNMEKLSVKYPDLHSKTYIAILDKLYKKNISYLDISASTYMCAVDTWNKFIVESKENFDLLISGEDIIF
jgi:hypothetical protein